MKYSKLGLCTIVFLVAILTGSLLPAQTLRYDLGQRLRRFETQFQTDLSVEPRKKALQPLKRAVQSFFGGKLTDAAQRMDEAWVQLLPESQQAAAKWVASRHIVAKSLLISEKFEFQLKQQYDAKATSISESKVACEVIPFVDGGPLKSEGTKSHFSEIDKVISVPVPEEGQYLVRVALECPGFSIPIGEVIVVRASDFQDRIDSLQAATKDNKATWNKSARSTIRQQAKWLASWAANNDAETNVPALQELMRMESIARHAESKNWLALSIAESKVASMPNFYATSFWLSVVGEGRRAARLRVHMPDRNTMLKAETESRKLPVVFALHGAGGSENMMFDAYGAGRIVDLCNQRGWILLAPNLQRTGLAIPDVVAQLEKQIPIDRDNVFVVGHSMGAGFAMREVKLANARTPRFEFRAVSPIGGGQATEIPAGDDDASLGTPFFVAAGSDDFGKSGASSLHRSLKRQALNSRYKEYEETEHMAIVQIALDDVFEFFDECLRQK